MNRTFDNFWRGWAQWATEWTNSWLQPPQPHQRAIIDAAVRHPAVAQQIVAGFDDARLFEPWWFDASAADAFLEEQRSAEASPFDARDPARSAAR